MTVTISPLERGDMPDFVRIELEAFRSHPRIPMLWPKGYTDDLYAYYETNKGESFDESQCRLMKATDDSTGKMVAVSEWTFALDTTKQLEKKPVDPNGTPPAHWPVGGNWEMKRFFSLNSEKWINEYLKGQPYIMLDFLVTDPGYQTKGAGTKLLAWGVSQADQNGVRMALEATPAGLTLYKRFGFREVDVVKADMKQFGFDKPYDPESAKRVWMIREPSAGAVRDG